MLKTVSLAAFAALAIACGKDEPRLDVDVSGSSFERFPLTGSPLRFATIPFDVKNVGGATAFVSACDSRISATIQKRVNDQWEQYSGGICFANLSMAPVPLREGERQHGDIGIGEAGRYRVRVFYGADASSQPSKSSASDAFDVH